MIGRELSANAVASQNAQATDKVWLLLVSISHAALSEPVRVVANNENITSLGRLFVAWEFDIVLPGEETPAKLSIGNIDPEILRTLRQISSPPTVQVEVVLSSNPDLVEIDFSDLVLRNANYDAGKIEGELAYEDISTEPVATSITPAMFPGLF